ncbi:hypothetical protein IWZ03DRAFT_177124 [Phyllosticta citriasiana]|uniref:Uncharacterized protein n=1 Tax=Phyllosticta citriasiana TaxID=595635 RepID=A0ABR1KMW0_9PEZI
MEKDRMDNASINQAGLAVVAATARNLGQGTEAMDMCGTTTHARTHKGDCIRFVSLLRFDPSFTPLSPLQACSSCFHFLSKKFFVFYSCLSVCLSIYRSCAQTLSAREGAEEQQQGADRSNQVFLRPFLPTSLRSMQVLLPPISLFFLRSIGALVRIVIAFLLPRTWMDGCRSVVVHIGISDLLRVLFGNAAVFWSVGTAGVGKKKMILLRTDCGCVLRATVRCCGWSWGAVVCCHRYA